VSNAVETAGQDMDQKAPNELCCVEWVVYAKRPFAGPKAVLRGGYNETGKPDLA
jgi:hypothetical protein